MNSVQFFSLTFSRGKFMKKVFATSCICFVMLSGGVYAQGTFFDDLIVSEELKQEKQSESGRFEAGKILDNKPMVLTIENQKKKVEKKEAPKPAPVIRDPAPLGLKWLATVDEIKYLKVFLTPIEIKDMPNSYEATNLPNPVTDFREVNLSFGENDALWRIAAYGKFLDDDSSASQGLKEFEKYYKLLDKKYGNAQEFYTPAMVNVDETVTNADGTQSPQTTTREMQIGEPGFLQKLASGEATLYATFENGNTGVTLALYADGDNQTYIVVDYKDLRAGKKELEELYNAL